MAKNPNWSKKEDAFLRKNYKKMTFGELAIHLNRSRGGVKNRTRRIWLTKRGRPNPVKIGERIGRWTVESLSERRRRTNRSVKYFWCRCDCGTVKEIIGACLRQGLSQSCGCLHRERKTKSAGQASWKAYLHTYSDSAKRRKLEFTFDIYDFMEICSKNCIHCGSEPRPWNVYLDGSKRNLHSETIDRAWIKINGIDRIDNKKGYEPTNCQSCCSRCNFMRNNLENQVFIEHCKKIAENYSRRCYSENGSVAKIETQLPLGEPGPGTSRLS